MLPTDKQARKDRPVASGVLEYFPDAIAEVAHVSFVGNQQHSPGQPMAWVRHKSTDHSDCCARHLLEHGTIDDDGLRHTAKLAWRALALLQIEIEAEQESKAEATVAFFHKRKVYLAGPMRGIKDFNFPAFDAARDNLISWGYDVISPADLDRKDGFNEKVNPSLPVNQREFVRRDVDALLSLGKDGLLVLLPGYYKSVGAMAEFAVAQWLGLEVQEYAFM